MPIHETRPSGAPSITTAQLTADGAAQVAVVNIRGMQFQVPDGLAIAPGTSIEFVNMDRAPHTVTSTARNPQGTGPLFDVLVPPGQRARLTFTVSQVGTHLFFCKFHPHMTGKFVVTGAATTGDVDRMGGTPPTPKVTTKPDLTRGLTPPRAPLSHLARCGTGGCA